MTDGLFAWRTTDDLFAWRTTDDLFAWRTTDDLSSWRTADNFSWRTTDDLPSADSRRSLLADISFLLRSFLRQLSDYGFRWFFLMVCLCS